VNDGYRQGAAGFIGWLDGVLVASESLANDQTVDESSYAESEGECRGEKTNLCGSARRGAHVGERDGAIANKKFSQSCAEIFCEILRLSILS
jgi:hypothetical protein